MTTKTKLSLLVGVSFALAATPALAQLTPGGSLNTSGPASATPNSSVTCADGTTQNGYVEQSSGDANSAAPHTDATVCAGQTLNQNYATSFLVPVTTVQGSAATQTRSGSATSSQPGVNETTTHWDYNTSPATQLGAPTTELLPIAGTTPSVTSFNYNRTLQTVAQAHYRGDFSASGTGATGTGSFNSFLSDEESSHWVSNTGTATFTPGAPGVINYTPVAGKYAHQTIDGNSVGAFDDVAGTSSETTQTANGFTSSANGATTTFNTAGVSTTGSSLNLQANGPSYVNVGANDVTIHGGTTSTTAVWNNSGYTQTDTTNGVTFTVDNNGNVQNLGNNTVGGNLQVNGNANVAGFTTTNGIDNTGNIETDTLLVNSTSTFNGLATFTAGVNVTGGTTTDTLLVTGNSQLQGNLDVAGLTTLNGGAVVNNGLTVNGGSTLNGGTTLNGGATVNGLLTANNGLAVTGGTTTDTLAVTSDATVGGNLGVTGTTTLTGLLTANGGATINNGLTVTGGANITGNSSVNGTLNVTGTVTAPTFSSASGIYSNTNNAGGQFIESNDGTNYYSNNQGVNNNDLYYATGSYSRYNQQRTTGDYVGDSTGAYANQTASGFTTNGTVSTGTLTTSGNATVGGTLAVTGATTTNGITNAGGIVNTGGLSTDTLTTSGNATVGGNLAVAGNYATTNGNITTTNGTISGASLVSTGATSVGTNLTVGGTSDFRGAIFNGGSANGGALYVNDALTVTGEVAVGTIRVNPTTNKISGLANATLSGTSTEAVTGQQLFATNNALAALDAREAAHFSLLMKRADKAYQGVAMGFASNSAPLNLANGEGGISAGVGVFQGEWAGAIRAQYVTDSGVGVGVNFGFSEDAVGGGVGASIKF